MRTQELHVHTTFCDGYDSPEEMVLAAIDRHLEGIAFTVHSFTSIDLDYCLTEARYPEYMAEIYRLQAKYRDRIRILCGIEQDYYSDIPVRCPNPKYHFDIVIGSVHYVPAEGRYFPLDNGPEDLKATRDRYFGGDGLALAEKYFELETQVIEKTNADLIAHFDVITKYNEDHSLFDPDDPRYERAWKKAADALLKTGRPFEVNTGDMCRGLRSEPYPTLEIQQYLVERGARLIPTNDCHSTAAVGWRPPEDAIFQRRDDTPTTPWAIRK